MTALYISELSSVIQFDKIISDKLDISGKRIGVLKGAMHDAIMIAQYGGIIETFNYTNTVHGIMDMIEQLESGEITGFVITKPIYFYFSRMIVENEKYKQFNPKVVKVGLYTTEITFPRDSFVTGMLLKHREDYEYLHRYFSSNWLQIQGCYLSSLNMKNTKFVPQLGSSMVGLFEPFLAGTLTIIGVMCVVGLFYEVRRRQKAGQNGIVPRERENVGAEIHMNNGVEREGTWVIQDVHD